MDTLKKVLVIDGEDANRESLKLILSEHYRMILTDSSEQGLDVLANASDLSLVFLNIQLPATCGLDTLKQIRNTHPKVKIIMVADFRSAETAKEALSLGAHGIASIPFKSDQILNLIRKHIS